MIAFVAWYLILTLVGWLSFPLVYCLFPALADRGYTLARAAGLLLWAYLFWLFTSLGISFNNVAGILFGLLPLLALSACALFLPAARAGVSKTPPDSADPGRRIDEITGWIRDHARLVVTTEVLFLAAFALLALLRAGNPTLDNAEKPMELMFINSILRSPSFPPHDGWLSGYAISYYYFGYVMTAMLARLTGVTGSIAHNLMTALIFALAAIGSYGILFNLLADRGESRQTSAGHALLAPLFMLVVSNVEGFLEVLHRSGILWSGTQNFWTWLDIKDLNQPPAAPLSWIPDRFWWWWRASRVISDYDMLGQTREVIDEFPFFSFLHADLHPHVLAIPFLLLTVAVALHMFLGGWRGRTGLFGLNLKIEVPGFLVAALVLGGLAFLNSWDILLGAALIVLTYGLMCSYREGWSWSRLVDMFALAVPLALAAVVLYLPFYFGFSSQAAGLLPNIVNPTRGAQLWVMWAPLLVPLLCYLLYLWRGERRPAKWRLAARVCLGAVLALWALDMLIALTFLWREPETAGSFLREQGALQVGALFVASTLHRLSFLGGLLTMLAVFVPSVAFIAAMSADTPALETPARSALPKSSRGAESWPPNGEHAAPTEVPSYYFYLLLIIIASLLIIGPEFLVLRDQFGDRMNTIFKFYYQAWLLWSIPAALAVSVLLRNLRGAMGWAFTAGIILLLIVSLTYPVLAVGNKTNGFNPPLGWTLDDFRRIERGNPDEAAAILWLKSAPDGVLAEAVGGSYTEYGRMSVYTGLPTLLGWPGHEVQWRGNAAPQGSRQDDIKLLYETPDWETALTILERYDIRYVYVGGLERSTYAVQEGKFQIHLALVFQQGAASIYEVP